MRLPDFFVIGAAKSGTTALYHYLAEHPQIYMSPMKEPYYFCFAQAEADLQAAIRHAPKKIRHDSILRYESIMRRLPMVCDFAAYCALFDGVTGEKAVGEASVFYLPYDGTAERIRQCVPDARLIAILRDPIERAYSSFAMNVREGKETITDFARVVQQEDLSVHNFWWGRPHHLRLGFYAEQLKRYYNTFDRSRIKVYLYDDLKADAVGLMRDIYRFLEVDDAFVPQVAVKHNVGGYPRNKTLHALLARSNPIRSLLRPLLPGSLRQMARHLKQRNMARSTPALSPELRQQLIPIFRDDILELQDMIQRDLSRWLK